MRGGGGGGGRRGKATSASAGGGGGGARVVVTLDEVTPGSTLTFNIGAGGAAGTHASQVSARATAGGDTNREEGPGRASRLSDPDEADDILTCGEENEKSERRPPLQSGREY